MSKGAPRTPKFYGDLAEEASAIAQRMPTEEARLVLLEVAAVFMNAALRVSCESELAWSISRRGGRSSRLGTIVERPPFT
jgi:hypothetical protein